MYDWGLGSIPSQQNFSYRPFFFTLKNTTIKNNWNAKNMISWLDLHSCVFVVFWQSRYSTMCYREIHIILHCIIQLIQPWILTFAFSFFFWKFFDDKHDFEIEKKKIDTFLVSCMQSRFVGCRLVIKYSLLVDFECNRK